MFSSVDVASRLAACNSTPKRPFCYRPSTDPTDRGPRRIGPMKHITVEIIGGGFCGTLAAIRLLTAARRGVASLPFGSRIVLIEPTRPGQGLAYARALTTGASTCPRPGGPRSPAGRRIFESARPRPTGAARRLPAGRGTANTSPIGSRWQNNGARAGSISTTLRAGDRSPRR